MGTYLDLLCILDVHCCLKALKGVIYIVHRVICSQAALGTVLENNVDGSGFVLSVLP